MEHVTQWSLAVAVIGVGIALVALIAPGLVYLGIRLGALTASNQSAHDRIDKLEKILQEGFKDLNYSLRESIREGWRHCPQILGDKHKGGDNA